MQRSEDIKEIAIALSKAQAVMHGAAKDAANPFFKSSYATLASVWDAAREPLTSNGLAVVQVTGEFNVNGEHGVELETTLMHSSGQWMSSYLPVRPTKDDPQGMGSALTYARRYSLAAMVGIAPEDDDDGNAASRPSDNNKAETKAKAKTAPKPQAKPSKMANGAQWSDSVIPEPANADDEEAWRGFFKAFRANLDTAEKDAGVDLARLNNWVEVHEPAFKDFAMCNGEGASALRDLIDKTRGNLSQKAAA